MAAHRHPVGFEFSVEMGIFQIAFLDFKEKKKINQTKPSHPWRSCSCIWLCSVCSVLQCSRINTSWRCYTKPET